MKKEFYLYIMASISKVLYVRVTNDLFRRVTEHKQGTGSQFTKKYHVTKLVYTEHHASITEAIQREKEIKGWKREREKKIALITSFNPKWVDLYALYQSR